MERDNANNFPPKARSKDTIYLPFNKLFSFLTLFHLSFAEECVNFAADFA